MTAGLLRNTLLRVLKSALRIQLFIIIVIIIILVHHTDVDEVCIADSKKRPGEKILKDALVRNYYNLMNVEESFIKKMNE